MSEKKDKMKIGKTCIFIKWLHVLVISILRVLFVQKIQTPLICYPFNYLPPPSTYPPFVAVVAPSRSTFPFWLEKKKKKAIKSLHLPSRLRDDIYSLFWLLFFLSIFNIYFQPFSRHCDKITILGVFSPFWS